MLFLSVVVVFVVVCSLFSSRIIDVGGRFVAAFLGRPQHSTQHSHTLGHERT